MAVNIHLRLRSIPVAARNTSPSQSESRHIHDKSRHNGGLSISRVIQGRSKLSGKDSAARPQLQVSRPCQPELRLFRNFFPLSKSIYRTAVSAPGGTLTRVSQGGSSPDEQHAKPSSKAAEHDRTWNHPSTMKQALNRESATRYMSKWRRIHLHSSPWISPFDSLGMSHLDLAFRRSVRRSLHQRCDKRATVQIAT